MNNTDRKPDGYWTQEHCYEEAQKYSSKQELYNNATGAYTAALKHGWINDYTWFKRPQPYNKKWFYDECYEEAKKYKFKQDFKFGSPTAYCVSQKNKWIKDYDWFEEVQKPRGYWTKERCREEALKYDRKVDFQKNSSAAYHKAHRSGWLDEITSHMQSYVDESKLSSNSYVIYVYEDSNNKVAYVGLTNNIKRRHREHKEKKNGKYDAVRKYFKEYVPEPIVLFSDLDVEEAKKKESETYYSYIKNNWILLNTESALGSIGGQIKIWTRNKCYHTAKEFDSKRDFREQYPSAYTIAFNNNWLKDYTWFKRPKPKNTKWNKESCEKEARKYSYKKEFQRNNIAAYTVALRNNWLNEYTWFRRPDTWNKKWTYDKCLEESKKYKSKKEFRDCSPGAYSAAYKNHWMKDFTWLNDNK